MKRKLITKRLLIVVGLIVLALLPVAVYAALAMTETEIAGQAWIEVLPATLNVGTTISLTTGYSKDLLIEAGVSEAGDFGGATLTVEISEDEKNWVTLTTVGLDADATVATENIDDASSEAGDATVTFHNGSEDDFDVVNRLWFIKDATIANSEVCRTVILATQTITLAAVTTHAHANDTTCYDRAYHRIVHIPASAAHARVNGYNDDAETNFCYAARPILLTGI